MYYQGLKKRQTFEEAIYDLQTFDKYIKYPKRNTTMIKSWLDIIVPQISQPLNYRDQQFKKALFDKAVQTELIQMAHKATQTDLNEKGIQVDINPNSSIYMKRLNPYFGPDVVDDSGWFNWKKPRKKATQTLSSSPIVGSKIRTPPSTPPSSNEYLPIIEPTIEDEPTMDDQILNLINPLLDTIYSPLTFGLGLLNYPPPISMHGSPPISIHGSPPISIHDSPPVSIHSSSTSKITSPPISIASSRSNSSSPSSPSEVPVIDIDPSPSPSPHVLDSLLDS